MYDVIWLKIEKILILLLLVLSTDLALNDSADNTTL